MKHRTAGPKGLLRRSALAAVVAVALAGCATTEAVRPAAKPAPAPAAAPPRAAAPVPAPAQVAVAPTIAPATAPATGTTVDLGPRVALPPPQASRSWDEFKRQAARRMVDASPKASYMGEPPPMLFGIPILETELNGDGSVRHISVTRPPANIDARNTIDYAMEAIRRGAPYGDMSRLPKPWKWTEVFLFNEQRQFKPRTLD